MKQLRATPTPKQATSQTTNSKSTFKRIPKQKAKITKLLKITERCCQNCPLCVPPGDYRDMLISTTYLIPAGRETVLHEQEIGCLTCCHGGQGDMSRISVGWQSALELLKAKLAAQGATFKGFQAGGAKNNGGAIHVEVEVDSDDPT